MNVYRGFTLIEVLVATVILFLSIATVAGVINAANFATLNVNKRLGFYSQMQSISADIRLQLLSSSVFIAQSGTGATADFRYHWTAEPINQLPSLGDGGEDFNGLIQGPTALALYNVDVTVVDGTRESRYVLNVLSWKDESADVN